MGRKGAYSTDKARRDKEFPIGSGSTVDTRSGVADSPWTRPVLHRKMGPGPAMIADYHLHTPLCRHAEGRPVDYLAVAAKLGLPEIGFADHAPTPTAKPWDDWRMSWEEFPRYLELVEEARREAAALAIPVRLGLECDFIAGRESWLEKTAGLADFDYLIGSVHYIEPGWAVDHPDYAARLGETDLDELWTRYWDLYVRMIRSGTVDILAHADLPKKFGPRPDGDRRPWYEPAIEAALEAGAVFEINTGGWRKPIGEAYPEPAFLRMACEAGVPLVIGSDAHAPGEVGSRFREACALARAAGYTRTVRFARRRKVFVDLPDGV